MVGNPHWWHIRLLKGNRDKSQTLEQNYKRLGLSTKLNASITGPRRIKGKKYDNAEAGKRDSLAIAPNNLHASTKPQEVQVERDPDTGKILRIMRPEQVEDERQPLDDPLNDISDDEETVGLPKGGTIIAQLEAQAAVEAEIEAKRKKPRQQSAREEDWIAKLVEAHGDDTTAMSRDRKLNPMQQSEGDITRRLKKWQQKHA